MTINTTTTGTSTSPTANGSNSDEAGSFHIGTRAEGVSASTSASVPQPLTTFVPEHSQASTGSATVVTVDGRVVVVLRADRTSGGVQVHDPVRSVHALPADTPATPVSDQHTRAEFLAAAAADLAGIHALDQNQLADTETRHQRVLNDIRGYVVERHVAGDLCRDGIDRFFEAFALPTYDPRVRVSYTITGSYEVDTDDTDTASGDARGYLKPELGELDNVIDDSDTYSVHIDHVDELGS